MVRLTRIYTKGGDSGQTSLGSGLRVPKDHKRIVAYGTVDELNSLIGLMVVHLSENEEKSLLLEIQNEAIDGRGRKAGRSSESRFGRKQSDRMAIVLNTLYRTSIRP